MRGAAPARRWAVCTALSLLIHAAVWWALHPAIGVPGHRQGVKASPRSRAVTTLTVAQARPQPPLPATATQAAAEHTPSPPSPLPAIKAPAAQASQPSLANNDSGSDNSDASNTADPADDTLFLPSTALDSPPQPQIPIDLQAPENMPDGTFKAQATLFIDEQGRVLRLRLDQVSTSTWPAALEEQVYRTFLAATFTPGEKEGRPVKSQMRIEVEFSTEPPPPIGPGGSTP